MLKEDKGFDVNQEVDKGYFWAYGFLQRGYRSR